MKIRPSNSRSRACVKASVSLVCALVACGADTEPQPKQPTSLDSTTPLVDTNPDPDIVEVQLVASAGRIRYLPDGDATIWGYRDDAKPNSKASVPGPALDVQQDQTVIVHFKNELPEATTIHWHGLRVPNASDGTPSVQVEVQPGDTYDYEFIARDAGTFWYHPHVSSDTQVERGLYGAVVVRGGIDLDVDADRTFVLDDVKLNADGELSPDTNQLDVMLGRQGNVLLANGVTSGRIVVHSGARERWRFVNAANGRYFNLRLVAQTLRVIGWDGGLIAEPYEVDTLLITPGERYEVLVDVRDKAGSELTLQTVHYDRGHDVPDPGALTVFKVAVQGTARKLAPLPDDWGPSVNLEVPKDAPERSFELAEREPEGDGFATFMVNGQMFPDVPPLTGRAGDTEVWRIFNNSEMDHPFHLHGTFFRVLDVDGESPQHDGWKDTVNVPRKKTLRFAVRYGDAGTWMFHCHILEHAERGMMGELQLSPAE